MILPFFSVSSRVRYALFALMQVALLPALWGHTSDSTAFLGRYSGRYGAALIAHLVILLVTGVMIWQAARVETLIEKIPLRLRIFGICAATLLAMAVWWPSLEIQMRAFAALTLTQIAGLLIWSVPERVINRRPFMIAVGVLVTVLIVPLALTIYTALPYSPDEAHWADLGSAYVRYGGLYTPSWQRAHILVEPGIGWSVAAYGALVDAAGYTVWVGRLWTFAVHALTIGLMGLVATRLWGRYSARATMLFAGLSFALFPILDYRPDYQLPVGQLLALLCVLKARRGKRNAEIWHLLCGLIVVLTMELHAAGIIVAFSFGVLYLFSAIGQWRAGDSWREILSDLLWFGLGGILGAVIYYLANIQSIGGLDVYLNQLVNERGIGGRPIKAFIWPSAYEGGFILAALAYYVYHLRQARMFPLLPILIGGTIVGALLFDTQGYFSLYKGLYLLPVGALLVRLFRRPDEPMGTNRRSLWFAVCVILCMAGQMTGGWISWDRISRIVEARALPPYPVEALGDQIRAEMPEGARIASTHEFIWSFADWPAFYSIGAEITLMRQQGLNSLIDSWDHLQPDTVVYLVNTMEMTPGLKAYMERDKFQMCKVYTYGDLRAELYRRTCP